MTVLDGGSAGERPHRVRVLHMMGSPTSEYYAALSLMYGKQCDEALKAPLADELEFVYAVVSPVGGGSWCFPAELTDVAIAKAGWLSHGEGFAACARLQADVCIHHMFCLQGVNQFRALLEVLGVPIVGASSEVMALTADKSWSRAIMAEAGARVARGETLTRGERPTIPPPVMLKPCCEDNSRGICLVQEESEMAAALETAFRFDERVVCEEFIPLGQEVRIGLLDRGAEGLVALPVVTYHFPPGKCVRDEAAKLQLAKDGTPLDQTPVSVSIGDAMDEKTYERLVDYAKRAHVALGCRDFSIFDVRISPDGEPHLLECNMFCSFSPRSVLVRMAEATGSADMQLPRLFSGLVCRALDRRAQ